MTATTERDIGLLVRQLNEEMDLPLETYTEISGKYVPQNLTYFVQKTTLEEERYAFNQMATKGTGVSYPSVKGQLTTAETSLLIQGFLDGVRAHKDKDSHLETYKVLCLSTGHLLKEDIFVLSTMATKFSMVTERDSGFFFKLLCGEGVTPEDNFASDDTPSEYLLAIVEWARKKGFSMLEIDADAKILENFPTFEW